jgi:MFS family permease
VESQPAALPVAERSAWRDRRFVVFAAGNLFNNIGDAVYAVALPLLVYHLTGSLTEMSVLGAQVSGTLLLGPVFGAVADRFGPRVLVLPGLAVQLMAGLALNLTLTAGRTSFALIFAFGAIVQIGGAAYRQGWMTGVPAMFPDNPVRSRGTLSSLYVTSTILGPLVLGAALHWVGYLGLLWANLATFGAPAAVWLAGVRPPAVDRRAGRFRLAAEITDGWRIIRSIPRVMQFTVLLLPLDFVVSSGTLTLAMYRLRDHFDVSADEVGVIFTVVNLGALCGSVTVSERSRLRLRPVLAVTSVGIAACLLVMSLPVFGVFVGALVLFFALDNALSVTSDMILVKYMPADAIGRTTGILRLLHGVPLVGAPLLLPPLVRILGVSATFVLLGLLALTAITWMIRQWSLWSDTPSAGGRDEPDPAVLHSGISQR